MNRRLPLAVLTVALALVAALIPATAEAQREVPVEAVETTFWFEADRQGVDLDEALSALSRSVVVKPNGDAENGFLAPLPYDPDQLTAIAENFAPGTTLQVWTELFCQDGESFEPLDSLRGRLRIQVWIEDSASGRFLRLTKIRARSAEGSVFGESGVKLVKLHRGDRLHFQLLGETVSPLESAYCYFGFGIYRLFDTVD